MKTIIVERETNINEFGEYVEDFYILGAFNTAREAADALYKYVLELAKDPSKKFGKSMLVYRDKTNHELSIQIVDEGKIVRRAVKFFGLIKEYEVPKSEMCKAVQDICSRDCEDCAWNIERGDNHDE